MSINRLLNNQPWTLTFHSVSHRRLAKVTFQLPGNRIYTECPVMVRHELIFFYSMLNASISFSASYTLMFGFNFVLSLNIVRYYIKDIKSKRQKRTLWDSNFQYGNAEGVITREISDLFDLKFRAWSPQNWNTSSQIMIPVNSRFKVRKYVVTNFPYIYIQSVLQTVKKYH